MSGKSVKLSNWPYGSNRTVKLASISKPYWKDTQYWIKVRFLAPTDVMYELPFTDLSMLIRGANYIDGKYNGIENTDTLMMDMKFTESNLPKPYPPKENRNPRDEYESYTFGFAYQGDYYVLPLEVLVRDIIAPDGELLHLMTSFDLRDKKFIYEMKNSAFYIQIMSDLPYAYSKNREKMMHLAWLFSNPRLEKMYAQAFENIRTGNGILFDWPFDHLKCIVSYETNNKGIRFIKGITSFTKKINASGIYVDDYRDSKPEGESSEKTKRNRIVVKDAEEIVSHGIGMTGDLSHRAINPTIIKYDMLPKYTRREHTASKIKTATTYNNQVAVIGNGRRTTGDRTGEKAIPKLIFKQHTSSSDDSEFLDISEALLIIQGDISVRKVESYISKLSMHNNCGVFRYLCDGKTERQYLAAKIIFRDSKEAIVLDLQREKRKISMLMLISSTTCEWEGIIHEIMKYTVEESGKWPTDRLRSISNAFLLRIDRCKHTYIGSEQLAKKILLKCQT